MEFLLYSSAGFAASALGAMPPGAVNLSVVYTTLNRGAKNALPIIISAAIGEILISFFAFHCMASIEEYIQRNLVIQYVIAALLIAAGAYLLFKKPSEKPNKKRKHNGFAQGLLLSVFNPPVLVFWLLAFAYLAANTSVHVEMSILQLTVLFFIGVFLGKIFTLWLYLQLSKRIEKYAQNVTHMVNKGIAGIILVIGVVRISQLLIA